VRDQHPSITPGVELDIQAFYMIDVVGQISGSKSRGCCGTSARAVRRVYAAKTNDHHSLRQTSSTQTSHIHTPHRPSAAHTLRRRRQRLIRPNLALDNFLDYTARSFVSAFPEVRSRSRQWPTLNPNPRRSRRLAVRRRRRCDQTTS
jgi:hypothetical protein